MYSGLHDLLFTLVCTYTNFKLYYLTKVLQVFLQFNVADNNLCVESTHKDDSFKSVI